MKKNTKILWKNGDVFTIQLVNGKLAIGQVLDLRWKNCVRCALFDEVLSDVKSLYLDDLCMYKDIISLIECTKEALDSGLWKIIGNKTILIPQRAYPNEQFRNVNWIGSKTYDASLIEHFINSYHSLLAWDDWADPNYFDKFLVDKSRKPTNLLYIKNK
jgi:immunity protein 26 of polymorphic toxin system